MEEALRQPKADVQSPRAEEQRFPAGSFAYSRFSPEAVRNYVVERFAIDESLECRFYISGLHDNFLLESDTNRYIARVYRNGWRTDQEILFELDFLNFLKSNACPVAAPLETTAGGFYTEVESPEGIRQIALFPFAPGKAPKDQLASFESEKLGRVVAQIHAVSDQYSARYKRQELDLDYLLFGSIGSIAPFVTDGDLNFLKSLSGRIVEFLPKLGHGAPFFGMCIGDVNPSNFHVDAAGNLTLFDFDQCGFSWRAFEIGKFLASIVNRDNAEVLERSFLTGYSAERKLTKEELRSLPYFKVIAFIWVMSLHAENVDYIGHACLQPEFWRKKMQRVRKLEAGISSG